MPVRRHYKVESSNLESVGFDPATNTLEIVFKTDPRWLYTYYNIEPQVFAELLNAESVGSYFSQNLRRLKFEKAARPYPTTVKPVVRTPMCVVCGIQEAVPSLGDGRRCAACATHKVK